MDQLTGFISRATLLAQGKPGGGDEGPGFMVMLLQIAPFILLFVIFQMLFLRPQQRKQAELQANLKVDDEVVTSGGIFGRVASVQDDRVVLKIDQNARMTVHKSRIESVIKPDEDKK